MGPCVYFVHFLFVGLFGPLRLSSFCHFFSFVLVNLSTHLQEAKIIHYTEKRTKIKAVALIQITSPRQKLGFHCIFFLQHKILFFSKIWPGSIAICIEQCNQIRCWRLSPSFNHSKQKCQVALTPLLPVRWSIRTNCFSLRLLPLLLPFHSCCCPPEGRGLIFNTDVWNALSPWPDCISWALMVITG